MKYEDVFDKVVEYSEEYFTKKSIGPSKEWVVDWVRKTWFPLSFCRPLIHDNDEFSGPDGIGLYCQENYGETWIVIDADGGSRGNPIVDMTSPYYNG